MSSFSRFSLKHNTQRWAGIIFLVMSLFSANTHFLIAANEFDGYLWYVKLWVPELPPSEKKLSADQQSEFDAVWKQTGIASKKLLSTWEQTLHTDPFIQRALHTLDRYGALENQYISLRHKLITQYGKQKFRVMETEGARWIKSQQVDWLDLKDQPLVALTIQVYKMNEYRLLTESDMFSQFISDKQKKLTDKEATVVYTRGIQWRRKQLEQNTNSTELPLLMQKYLMVRAEADFLYFVSETYLRTMLEPKLKQAKQEYSRLITRAATIRPDLNDVLIKMKQSKATQSTSNINAPKKQSSKQNGK